MVNDASQSVNKTYTANVVIHLQAFGLNYTFYVYWV